MAEDEGLTLDELHMDSEIAERLGVRGLMSEVKKTNGTAPSQSTSTSHSIENSSLACYTADENAPGSLIPELEPFSHMLPQSIRLVDAQEQQLLYKAILEAGMKAYQHLLHYVVIYASDESSDSSVASGSPVPPASSPNPLPYAVSRLASLESEFENISMLERIDQAFETLIEVGEGPLPPANIVAGTPEATPQIAANTLGLFAGAALRHPPTRTAETLMASVQETGGPSEIDHQDALYDPDVDEELTPCEDGLICLACSAGFTRLADMLLHLRGAPLFSSVTDTTPLMESCTSGAVGCVRNLLSMGADVNAESRSKNTALIYASASGQEECVQLLLSVDGVNVEKINENGHCALMEAASAGHLDIVKLLIGAGAQQVFVTMNSEFKESPLTLAAYKGHLEVVKYLLEVGTGCLSEEELHTALMEASMDGHVEVARALLDGGAQVNMQSESYESPLTLACCGGHDILVKMLLEAGAYIEEPNDESYTPLMEAAREGHASVVQVLLDRGAQVNAQTEETGETALTVAACGGYTDVLDLLVKAGGDLELGANTPLMEAAQEGHVGTVMYILGVSRAENSKCSQLAEHSDTALALAADNGHLDVLEVLATSGADINKESEGRTPLMKACKNGFTDIVVYLIGKGVNVNYIAEAGDATSLSLACATGHKEIVKNLLRAGADPNVELKDGVTCVLEAAKNGHVEIVELMLDHNGVLPQTAKATVVGKGSTSNNVPSQKATRRKKTGQATASNVQDQMLTALSEAVNGNNAPNSFDYENNPHSNTLEAFLSQSPFDANYSQLSHPHLQALASYVSQLPGFASQFLSQAAAAAAAASTSSNVATCVTGTPVAVTSPNAVAVPPTTTSSTSSNTSTAPPIDVPQPPPTSPVTNNPTDGNCGTLPPTGTTNTLPATAQSSAVSTTSGNFLSSTYENVKKKLSGLPLASNLPGSPVPPNPLPPSSLPVVPTTSVPVTNNTQAVVSRTPCAPLACTSNQKLILDPRTARDNLLQQFTTPMTPENRRATRRKLNEMFGSEIAACSENTSVTPDVNSLKNFLELFQEWARMNQNNEIMFDNETTCLTETLKVLRPTVTSLPGGVVASDAGAAASVMSSVVFPPNMPNANIPPTVPPGHRRTLSEGDEVDTTSFRTPTALRTSFDVDKATESNNDTPLTLACTNGHKDMVNVLVGRGANIEHRDKKGFTPLILAATGGHVGVVQALLTAGANIEAQSERTKDTALSLACSGGRKEVVEILLAHGANKEHRNVSDYTPLSLAASGGYVEIVNMLLQAGAEINSRTGSKLGISPLMLAAMNGHKDATRVLLEKGSDINAQIETNRNTALTLACFQGRTDVVRLLLQYHANVEHRAKTGLTPLMEAANGGYVEVGELLLEHFADPNTTPVPSSRDTALTIAADKGHDKFVDMLVQRNAAIDAKNKKGCTALWLACHGGHLNTVQTLVVHHADVDAQDNRKVSALTIAFRKGHVKVVEFLVNHVKQFPNEQEMQRYMSTIQAIDGKPAKELQELAANCHKCRLIILTATKAQAEQANKAAEMLLAMLAEEEEMAKTKKEKKQKKREEKKAKKSKKVETDKAKSPPVVDCKDDEPPRVKEEHSEEDTEDDSENVNSQPINTETVRPPPPVDDRVPNVVNTEIVAPSVSVETTSSINKQKRQTSRRSRNESGKSVSTSLVISAKTSANTAPLKPSPQSEEWVKAAGKKKQAKVKPSQSPSSLSQKDYYVDENGAFGGWKDVELSRRHLMTLNVGSSVIARVIGRGGANINAIREATGASIEVEKQTLKREQLERQIFIRGTHETVRNASQMINGLISDIDTTVTDIIRQVLRGNTSVASSSSESGSRTGSNCTSKTTAHSSNNTKAAVTQPPATTNVWQQRMAARQQQINNVSKDDSSARATTPLSSSVSPSATTVSESEHVVNVAPVAAAIPTPTTPQPVKQPSTMVPSEDELRKAPGYRPHISNSSNNSTSSPAKNNVSSDLSYSTPINNSKSVVEDSPGIPTINSIGSDHLDILSKRESGDSLLVSGEIGFLDTSKHSKLAEIWGQDTRSSANESAWNSQLLLNNISGNLSNLSLDTSSAAWQLPNDSDFMGLSFSPPKSVAPTNTGSLSSNEWMAPGNKSALSFARPQPQQSRTISSAQNVPQPSQHPARSFSNLQQPVQQPNIYNQLAAQIQAHQESSAGSAPSTNSPYFSYNDSSLGSLNHQNSTHSQASKAYNSTYQNANQEYENLQHVIGTYHPHHVSHGNGDFNGAPNHYGGSSSSIAPRNVMNTHANVGYAPAPPPGFGSIVPPVSAPLGANTAVPPPPMRNNFYNNQIPPPAAHSSAFNIFNAQQQTNNTWSQSSSTSSQQMPWSGGWN